MRAVLWIPVLVTGIASLVTACQRGPDPTAGGEIAGFEAVAQAVARGEDRVSPDELAAWIIEDRRDFVLVDIRDAEAWEQDRIEGAIPIPLVQLVTGAAIDSLPVDRTIVVYSTGSENAAKAAVMLRLAGRDARLLSGGFNFWTSRIENPDIPASAADDETPRIAKRRAIYCYFAGESAPRDAPPAPAEPAGYLPPVSPVTDWSRSGGPLVIEEGC